MPGLGLFPGSFAPQLSVQGPGLWVNKEVFYSRLSRPLILTQSLVKRLTTCSVYASCPSASFSLINVSQFRQ